MSGIIVLAKSLLICPVTLPIFIELAPKHTSKIVEVFGSALSKSWFGKFCNHNSEDMISNRGYLKSTCQTHPRYLFVDKINSAPELCCSTTLITPDFQPHLKKSKYHRSMTHQPLVLPWV